jgi:hypothetical protein
MLLLDWLYKKITKNPNGFFKGPPESFGIEPMSVDEEVVPGQATPNEVPHSAAASQDDQPVHATPAQPIRSTADFLSRVFRIVQESILGLASASQSMTPAQTPPSTGKPPSNPSARPVPADEGTAAVAFEFLSTLSFALLYLVLQTVAVLTTTSI